MVNWHVRRESTPHLGGLVGLPGIGLMTPGAAIDLATQLTYAAYEGRPEAPDLVERYKALLQGNVEWVGE